MLFGGLIIGILRFRCMEGEHNERVYENRLLIKCRSDQVKKTKCADS